MSVRIRGVVEFVISFKVKKIRKFGEGQTKEGQLLWTGVMRGLRQIFFSLKPSMLGRFTESHAKYCGLLNTAYTMTCSAYAGDCVLCLRRILGRN